MSALLSESPVGIIEGEPNEVYHGTDAVSASKLRVFKRKPGGPQLYHQTFIAKTIERETSDAMAFGTALHCAVLEPEKFETSIAIAPEGIDRRTTLWKQAWAAFQQSAVGKTIITAEQGKLIDALVSQIAGHYSASRLLANGKPELSWRVQAAGLKHLPPLQCRTDWFNENGCAITDFRPYVVDLKTCATLDRDAFGNFSRSAKDHAYHNQAALYMAIMSALGVECRDFFFVAVEKVAPYGVEVYRLSDATLARAQEEVSELLIDLDKCYELNTWPNASVDVQELVIRKGWSREEEEI